jgi:hypothetical protein
MERIKMADVIVEGDLTKKDSATGKVVVAGKLYALTEKAFKFCPAIGTRVKLTLGRESIGYFIEEIDEKGEPSLPMPKPAQKQYPQQAPRKESQNDTREPAVRSELLKQCLSESARIWNELIGTADMPGDLYKLAVKMETKEVTVSGVTTTKVEAGIDGPLVLEHVVKCAQSLYIDATKEGRMNRMGY